MSDLGIHPRVIHRVQRYGRVIVVALVLGCGLFLWVNTVWADPLLALGVTVSAWLLLGLPWALSRQLTLAKSQRDQALARANATDVQMADLLQNHDQRVQVYVAQRMQVLQSEIADLRSRCVVLQEQAHHDELTGLANRLLLTERFFSAAKRAKRSGKAFALLMIDLNGFKVINDNHGHAAGDSVLINMANRLVGAVRACDTVARLGGDEFVLIIEDIEDPQELVNMGQKLIATLSVPISLERGAVVTAGASVGLALYPHHGTEMNDLLYVADQSMYECKSTGQMSLQ
jgi:diguanylate cyclase (GGDEF)-like protein